MSKALWLTFPWISPINLWFCGMGHWVKNPYFYWQEWGPVGLNGSRLFPPFLNENCFANIIVLTCHLLQCQLFKGEVQKNSIVSSLSSRWLPNWLIFLGGIERETPGCKPTKHQNSNKHTLFQWALCKNKYVLCQLRV